MRGLIPSSSARRRASSLVTCTAIALGSCFGAALAQDAVSIGRSGQSHLALGDYNAARDELSRALEVGKNELTPAQSAALLNDLGAAYMALDEPSNGLAAFTDARRLVPQGTTLEVIAGVNVARALEANGAFAGLVDRLQALRSGASRLEPTTARAEISLSLAELYRNAYAREPQRGDLAREAVELAEGARATAVDAGDTRLLAEAYGALGAARAALGSLDEALADTRQAVTLAQAAGANESLYRWEWQTARLLRTQGDAEGALDMYAAAIETLGTTRFATSTSRSGFARDVLQLYEEYADLMLARARTLDSAAAGSALAEVQRTLETLRVAEVRNYFENQCSVPAVYESPTSQQPVVVIYPVVFADRTELLVRTGQELRQITVAVDLPTLTSAIASLRQAIEDPEAGDAFLRPARLIYGWFIEPLEPLLLAAKPTTLIIVPDGPLRTVPFGVLHDGDRFLMERYSLGITPALSLVGAVSAQPISRVLLNGIIAPTQGFPGLPFVAQELANIGERFPSRAYTDEGFVTATLEREMVEGGYSIVHMATHAQFASDYRRSFLLAHNDLITMDELEDAVGSQRFSDRAVDLLVLSACSTAAGDERAALGLAGVAVKAGARSALASLWAVNDESTAVLVGEFYRQLAGGAGKADALRGAQLALLNDVRYSHPAYWAPFLMIGDWR